MTIEIEYIARKKMKYNGQQVLPGDVWEPAGGKWDAALIAKGYVEAREVTANPGNLTLTELRNKAKAAGIDRYWQKSREKLLAELGGGE